MQPFLEKNLYVQLQKIKEFVEYTAYVQARGPRIFGPPSKLQKIKTSNTTPSRLPTERSTESSSTSANIVVDVNHHHIVCSNCEKSKIPSRGFFWAKVSSIVYIWADFDSIQQQEYVKNRALIHRLIRAIHHDAIVLLEDFPTKCCVHRIKDVILKQGADLIICFGKESLSLFCDTLPPTKNLGNEIPLNGMRILCTYHPNEIRNGSKELLHTVWGQHLKKGLLQ